MLIEEEKNAFLHIGRDNINKPAIYNWYFYYILLVNAKYKHMINFIDRNKLYVDPLSEGTTSF